MSVCLASIGGGVYTFIASHGAVGVYPLNNEGTTSFNLMQPENNLILTDPTGNATLANLISSSWEIKLCAIAENRLFILGGFGNNSAVVLLNLEDETDLTATFHITPSPIAPTSFTALVQNTIYYVIFSAGGKLSKGFFSDISALTLDNDDDTRAGSVLAVTGTTTSNTNSLYDLVNDKLLVYDVNVASRTITVSSDTNLILNVENPVHASGQLLPIHITNPSMFEALLTTSNALYHVKTKNETNSTSSSGLDLKGLSTPTVKPANDSAPSIASAPSSNSGTIIISQLYPPSVDKTGGYTYFYANGKVYFANTQVGGSVSLYSLLQAAAASPSTPGNTSSIVAGPTGTTIPEPAGNSSNNNTGAIAGGVVGGLIALAIIGALFFWYHRRKRRQTQARSTSGEIEKVSLQNSSHEKEPLDGANAVDIVTLSAAELQALDPLTTAGAVIFGGAYQVPHGEQAILVSASGTRIPHYALRTITNSHGEAFSLHYFGAESYIPFLRNVAVTEALGQSNAVVRTVRAVQPVKPVVSTAGTFQYMWITSPATIPTQSLDYLLQAPGLFDVTDGAFRAWSILTMLEAVRDLHGAGYVHLDIRPAHFYYPDPDQVDRWKLSGFESAVKANYQIGKIGPNAYQAPELTGPHVRADPSADIWSLGWVIFYLLTGEGPQPDEQVAIDRVQQGDVSYGTLLLHMLQRIPKERHSALELAKYWKESQNMEDDT